MYKIIFFVSFFLFNVSFSAGVLEKSLDYDTNSNISTLFVPHAGKITYSYDPLNRLKEANYPNGETVKYTYDYNSNLIEITDIHGVTSYSFDALNRLVAAQFPDNSTVSYEYDLANRIVKITYPDKEEVKYNYDTRGRLTAVFDQTGITRYEYDGQTNLVIKECLPNGITTEYKYDSFPRVIEVSHKDSAGKLIVEYTFAYDNNDNCNRVIEKTTHQTTETTYSYDVLNRLVEAHYPNNKFEKYIYDGAGNRLAKTTQNGTIKYEYDIYNRLIEVGEARFYYDDSGNLTKKSF